MKRHTKQELRNLVDRGAKNYIAEGYSSLQAKQLAWIDLMEPHESLTNLKSYNLTCVQCKTAQSCHSADTLRFLINEEHRGHMTWISRL